MVDDSVERLRLRGGSLKYRFESCPDCIEGLLLIHSRVGAESIELEFGQVAVIGNDFA